MDQHHRIDALTRSLTILPSRRDVLRGLAGLGFGFGIARLPANADAKKKRKRRKRVKQAKPNAFGCLDVGQPCRGKNTLCCSGVCGGKKPKKGEKDKRACIGHNEGGCTADRNLCVTNSALRSLCNPAVLTAVCFATTGNAGFCGNTALFDAEVNCQRCVKDTDCETAGFPLGSACIIIDPEGDLCGDVCAATENRACMLPGI